MPNFMLAYKGGSTPENEADRQAVMAAWGAWFGGLGAAVVDGGNPFGPSATVGAGGAVGGSASSSLTGYTILTAGSLGEATEMAKGCPILSDGGDVEVYEIIPAM